MNVVPVHVLFTCTANQVRSPFAAAIATRHVDEQGLAVVVRSAGQLRSGTPAADKIVKVAHAFDVDLSGHRSTRVSPELLESSDLVVTMTGQHVLNLIELAPECRDRTITLREWARATADGHPVPGWTPEQVRGWAADISQRPLSALISGSVDVTDPIGRSTRVFRSTAQEISDLLAVCFADD